MSFRWRGITYPTPFVFKWSSRRTNVERRGQPVRQNEFDQSGGAVFEFEDGFKVYESQNAVQFLSKEIRDSLVKKQIGHRQSKATWYKGESKREFVTVAARYRREKKHNALIKKAKQAGIRIDKPMAALHICKVPHEFRSAVKYAAELKGMTMTQWMYEAIKDRLGKELFDQDYHDKKAIKEIVDMDIR